jgi:protein-S-isoprenylcysteine O-methyltransferase Ste14
MPNPILIIRWLALLSVLFWFIVYWQGGRKALIDIQNSLRAENTRLDAVLMITMLLASLAAVGNSLLVSLGLVTTSENWMSALAGFLLVITGIAGTFYCRQSLGRFWTAETTLRSGHQVVDQGPYGIVRHPIYTFAILMYLGMGGVFPTWLGLLSAIVIAAAYACKAWDEDRYLTQSLAGYPEYRQRVRYRLVPGIW